MHVLIVIPARGGSKGLPGKNLQRVGGVSLVGRAVYAAREFAQSLGHESTILVDTDSSEIAEEGIAWGAQVPFLRPETLAGDTTPTADNVLHAANRLAEQGTAADVIVLLQPTSPLRTAGDIQRCWQAFDVSSAPSVISIVGADHPLALAMRASENGVLAWAGDGPSADVRRQAYAPVVYPNGAVYIISRALLAHHRAFIVAGVTRGVSMAPERSVDIDTAADLTIASALALTAPVQVFTLGAFEVRRNRCFIIAAADVDHTGDVTQAHKLVDVAADAGADCVKFQAADATLAPTAHKELMDHARERRLVFLSTPLDERSADVLEELGVSAFEIPSGEAGNHHLLRHLARKERPLLMPSGNATMAEMASAVLQVRATSGVPLALLHGATSHLASPEGCNLHAMDSMRALFGVPVGWNDRTMRLEISFAAAAQGAELLEKPFTLDREKRGPDHAASLEPGELAALVRGVRAINAAAGDGLARPGHKGLATPRDS